MSGPVWHGEALGELLAQVSAAQALAHPVPGAHSIWELVHHVTAWATIATARLSPRALEDPDDETDWPPVLRRTPTAWKAARSGLAASHAALATAVRALDPATLSRRVPGRKYTVRTMLHGVVEHGAYHGGQIALLTKARPDRPSP